MNLINRRKIDSTVRKLKKLKRDPKLFFNDMVKKRSQQVLAKIPAKYSGSNQFTVVSAVYNVEKYLDDYFKSLVNQTLDFEKHIQLILVDDGSIDSSYQIIKKWQKRYPNNIHYYHKENGGQASARNFGIDFIQTEWCTFIDPDDFVDLNYFRNIDLVIEEKKNLWMVSCNLIYYYEQSKQYKDTHPQNYKFKQKITCFDVRDENQFIQLSVSLAILKTQIIQEHKLNFDIRIKPSFEDATFMMHYALALYEKQGQIAFLKDAKYFYRKREDGTSTLDTGWIKPSSYDDVLRYGCLQTLKDYNALLGFVPKFIQTTIIYYHIWQIYGIVNKNNALNFLNEQQKVIYLELLREIFTYIDENTIDQFSLAGAWFFEKSGMLNLYKGIGPTADKQIVYIEKYDTHKNEVLMYYFAPKDSQAIFYNNDIVIEPSYKKILRHSFLSKTFVYEYRYWIPLTENGMLTVEVNYNKTKIGFAGQHIRMPVSMAKVREYYMSQYLYPNQENSWIIMDRDVQADDNAEHFYRYLMQHQPQQKIYFALRRNSHDWERLETEGFNLLAFGTPKFENVLKSCSKIISSHIDDYIVNYFGDGGLKGKDFIFLPHGITQNDLHSWYNSKLQYMSLMTVASYDEYHSIVDDNNHYKYGMKEIKLTGFPRHDALLRGNQYGTKRIVVMPTWRKYLLDQFNKQTGTFAKNKDFMQSEYAKHWQSFLQSEGLQKLIKQYGYEVVFAPHKNTEIYLNDFKLPKNIQLWQANPNESIQKLFQTSDIMITDYSSVAFEMGYLGKPVLYYQFDFDDFFSNQWQSGYFKYEKHGFGAVAYEEEKLLSDLQAILANYGKPLPEYQDRIEKTFAYHDSNNCERVYKAILTLDEKPSSDSQNETIFNAMNQFYQQENYALSQKHAEFLLKMESVEYVSDQQKALSIHILFNSLLNQQQIAKAITIGKQYCELLSHSDSIKLAYWLADWQQVIDLTTKSIPENQNERFMQQYAQIELDLPLLQQKFLINFPELKEWRNKVELNENDILLVVQIALAWIKEKSWQKVAQKLPEFIDYLMETGTKWLAYYPLQLLLVKAYRSLGEYKLANQQLSNYEQHTQDDAKCHLEIARLANEQKDWVRCVEQFQQAMKNQMENLLVVDQERYILALSYQQAKEELNKWLPIFLLQQPNNQTFILVYAYQLIEGKNWQDFLVLYPKLQIKEQKTLQYFELLAKYRLGMLEKIKIIQRPTYQDSYEYYLLVMEIAFMKEDLMLFKYCYQQIMAIYPEKYGELTKKCSELMKFQHIINNFWTILDN